MIYILLSAFSFCVFAETQHVVSQGDTIFSIARKYSVDRQAILDKNKLNDSGIKIGQKLSIPDSKTTKVDSEPKKDDKKSTSKPSDSPKKDVAKTGSEKISSDKIEKKVHVVQSKETLASISRKYEIKLSELAAMNSFGVDHKVKVGEKIIISKQAQAPTAKVENASLKKEEKIEKPPVHSESKSSGNACGFIFTSPIKNPISSSADADGITYSAESSSSVRAVADGTVAYIGDGIEKYGSIIVLKHQDGILTIYGHLLEQNIKLGDSIKKQDVIGRSTDKLYFGVRKLKKPVDPKLCMV